MINEAEIQKLIYTALETVNEEQAPAQRFVVDQNTILFGVNASIDSLSLVSLIVDIESALNGDFNLEISLTDDRAMTREISPFTDVKALQTFIMELVGELQ